MKILLACQQSPNRYPIPAYDFWRTYFVEGLKEAGHEVVEVSGTDWARGLTEMSARDRSTWRDQIWSHLLETIRHRSGIDLLLGYFYPQQIEPSAVREVRRLGVPAVNFFCDNVREFRRLPKEFRPFDLHWVPEYEALSLYSAEGLPAISAPMPCWVPPTVRVVPSFETERVTFVGRRDPLRGKLLAEVAQAGLPLSVFGAGWNGKEDNGSNVRPSWTARWNDWREFYRRQGFQPAWRRLTGRASQTAVVDDFDFARWSGDSVGNDIYHEVLSNSAVTLGINRFPEILNPSPPHTYSRLRDIEAPMLGACYLTEWAPELPHLYELGAEIETYRDAPELVEKCRALLADSNRRRRLREAGLRRVHRDHTVGASMAKIAQRIGLSSA